jgi:hypothetical protein
VAVLFQQRQLRAAKVKVFVEFLHDTFRKYRAHAGHASGHGAGDTDDRYAPAPG